jgi:glycosyltransferase involved in cell wall biosynthesis
MEWHLAIDAVLFVIVAFTCFYESYYVFHSFFVRVGRAFQPADLSPEPPAVSILIPVFNSARTLDACLSAVLRNNPAYITDVVVALDHSTDNSAGIVYGFQQRFDEKGIPFTVVELGASRFGKVACMLEGGKHLRSATALLLDSDIILDPVAVESLVRFHHEGNVFSSCLIFPYQDSTKPTLVQHLICNNRMYRQGVLQNVKNRFGLANFPGGLQLVDFGRYRALLVDGFLEDLVATYRVLSTGGRVAILPQVLAYEVERQTIKGLLLQRTRWTIGAIQNVRAQIRTARTRRPWNDKIVINSFHVMWELQHYVNTLGIVMAVIQPQYAAVFLMPAALYILQIARSAFLGRHAYRNSLAGITAHCLFYPAILTAALFGAACLLIKRRRFFFKTQILFSRD